jgi:hypothetical protein
MPPFIFLILSMFLDGYGDDSPGQPLLSIGISEAAVNQGMERAFIVVILVIIGMFIAGLFIRRTGKIV